MSTTAGFDLVVQISEVALNTLARAMHAGEVIDHVATRVSDGRLAELIADAPALRLDTSAPAGRLGVTATTRLLYCSHPVADRSTLGEVCTCDAAVRFAAFVSNADPAPVAADTTITFDESATSLSDVTVHHTDPTVRAQAAADVVAVVHDRGAGQAGVGSLPAAGTTSVGMRVVPGIGSQPPCAAVGVNLATGTGTAAALSANLCYADWAVAVSRARLEAEILLNLEQSLGGLPPPHGTAPVHIGTAGTDPVFLDTFDVALAGGSLAFAGTMRRAGGGPFGTITATWSLPVELTIGTNGGVKAVAGAVSVTVHELWGSIANFLSGGAIERGVAEAVTSALAVGLSDRVAEPIDILTRQLAWAGRGQATPLTPTAQSVDVRSDAVIVHGSLAPTSAPPPPVAALGVALGSTPTTLVFSSIGSWSPGGSIATLSYQFDDGTTVQGSGQQIRAATAHAYAVPGNHTVVLTVTDSLGRSVVAQRGVTPGRIVIEQVGRSRPGEFCQGDPVMFRTTSSGCPLPGVTVRVEGDGWQVTGVSDSHGSVTISVDASLVATAGLVGAKPSAFHVGLVRVVAERSGWQGLQQFLWMVDCASLQQAALDAARHRQEIIDFLIGLHFLDELTGRSEWRDNLVRQILGEDPFPDPGDPDPWLTRTRSQFIDAIEVVTALERLALHGNPILGDITHELMGPDVIASAWDHLQRAAADIDAHVDRRDPHPH
jgi:hypothetical protein